MMRLILALCLLPTLACAESATVGRTVRGVVLPAFAELASSTQTLADVAKADCRASNPALQVAYNAAFDAWLGVETYRAGPLETDGNALSIAFWPDLKGAGPKALRSLLAQGTIPQGAAFADTSVAARGIFGLEAMLYDPAFNGYGPSDAGCALTQAISADLAATSARVNAAWITEFAPLMLMAGAQGNTRFLSPDEVVQSFYTAALTELEYIADVRLARPLGDPDRPRPARAEARLSGRSLRNVTVSVQAVTQLAQALAGVDKGDMFDRLAYVQFAAAKIKDPVFADIDTSSGHFRLLEVQNAVKSARDAVSTDLGVRLGVSAGFNGLDGD